MTKDLIIIALILLLIYLYYQNSQLKGLPHSGNSSQTIFELDERSPSALDKDDETKEELVADRDQAIREKKEAEAEVLSLNNRLKNKQQEVTKKESEIERLKKEKSSSEISLNNKLKEKNGLITTQQNELNQLKEKYSKQGKLLDEEQTDNNKLTEKIAQLETQIKELQKSSMPGSWEEKDWPPLSSPKTKKDKK